jgi:hypothetical protein
MVESRLRGEFSLLLGEFPPAVRTGAAVTKHLGLNGPICFRLLSGLRSTEGPSVFFDTIPGPEGLGRILSAAEHTGASLGRVQSVRAAIDEFRSLLQHAGGSQRKLVALLPKPHAGQGAETAPPAALGETEPGSPLADKRMAFTAAARLMHCQSDGLTMVRICTPEDDRFAELSLCSCIGRLGYVRSSPAFPLVFTNRFSNVVRGNLPGAGDSPLMAEFCSQPLPPVTSDQRGDMLVFVIDPDHRRHDPVDVVVGPWQSRVGEWTSASGRGFNISSAATTPTRWMLADTYFPAEMIARYEVTTGAYTVAGIDAFPSDPADRWFHRFPGSVPPVMLGRGLTNADSDRWACQRLLTERMFAAAGADPTKYVGFRVQVDYPLPSTQYLLSVRTTKGERT